MYFTLNLQNNKNNSILQEMLCVYKQSYNSIILVVLLRRCYKLIQIYKSESEFDPSLKLIDTIENGAWINLIAPSAEELILISKKTGVPLEFLKAALDDEETSRIDIEEDSLLIIVDIPFTEMEDNSLTYDTYHYQ